MPRNRVYLAFMILVLLVGAYTIYEYALTIRPNPDPAFYQRRNPLQYASFIRGKEQTGKESKLAKFPELVQIYSGMPFSEDYFTTRNHNFALEDLAAIRRGKPTAFCFTCKTADFGPLVQELGELPFNSTSYSDMAARVKHSISCIDCHNPRDFSLNITRPSLIRALPYAGVELARATTADLRSLTCAQCHVEYFFNRSTNELILPWNNGLTVEAVERFFLERNWADWTLPLAGAALVKIQHPEYENFQGSVHQRLGLACADCHMPKKEVDGRTITSHAFRSPLETMESSCTRAGCHTAGGQLLHRVRAIQEETLAGLKETASLLGQAAVALDEAKQRGATGDQLAEARALYARAHIRWDWVQSENGQGFHNPAAASRMLEEVRQFAAGSLEKAQALGRP